MTATDYFGTIRDWPLRQLFVSSLQSVPAFTESEKEKEEEVENVPSIVFVRTRRVTMVTVFANYMTQLA